MLAIAAVLWIFADASFESLAVTPPGAQNGAGAYAGIAITQTLTPALQLAVRGRAGASYGGDWRPIFEGAAEVWWKDAFEAFAGIRHDERLRREGALADFRDPTGRIFVGAGVMPLHRGAFGAGATVEYERALPGVDRLPSGVRVSAVGRLQWRHGR